MDDAPECVVHERTHFGPVHGGGILNASLYLLSSSSVPSRGRERKRSSLSVCVSCCFPILLPLPSLSLCLRRHNLNVVSLFRGVTRSLQRGEIGLAKLETALLALARPRERGRGRTSWPWGTHRPTAEREGGTNECAREAMRRRRKGLARSSSCAVSKSSPLLSLCSCVGQGDALRERRKGPRRGFHRSGRKRGEGHFQASRDEKTRPIELPQTRAPHTHPLFDVTFP